jgi:hypothetical protein
LEDRPELGLASFGLAGKLRPESYSGFAPVAGSANFSFLRGRHGESVRDLRQRSGGGQQRQPLQGTHAPPLHAQLGDREDRPPRWRPAPEDAGLHPLPAHLDEVRLSPNLDAGSALSLAQLAQHRDHLQRRLGGIRPLVAELATRSLLGLGDGVHCQDPKSDGNPMLPCQSRDP